MPQTISERATEQIADSASQASRVTSAVADVIEDGVGVARRVARHGGDVAKGFLEGTSQRVQRFPWLMLATIFVGGFAAGAVLGWITKQK